MSTFEILCVTMNQTDFSKIGEMNICSNVVFANQADDTRFEEIKHEDYYAKMITTNTRGVGKNRNLALMYATADICLFADDDIVYYDGLEEKIVSEFEKHPDADIIIFNLDTDSDRKQIKYTKTKKCSRFVRMPWGSVRIAAKTSSIKKANVWFTTLFGGGCVFSSGEDSTWLKDVNRKGLTFYVSDKSIGKIYFDESSWFEGFNEKFFYSKGAFLKSMYPKTAYLWILYLVFRYRKNEGITNKDRWNWACYGIKGYKEMLGFDDYCTKYKKIIYGVIK